MPPREVIAVATVADGDALSAIAAELDTHRAALARRGVTARTAAFTSLTPGADVARLAQEQDVDLVVVDAPVGLLEDGRVLALLEHAPCDVAVLAGAAGGSGAADAPIFVPFGGASHDWAAVEIGAWLARAHSVPCASRAPPPVMRASATRAACSQAHRWRCSVPWASQPSPCSSHPTPTRCWPPRAEPSMVVVGLTERWRRHGLGPARTALATRARVPALLVRGGSRPSGLAPGGSETRFTWTWPRPDRVQRITSERQADVREGRPDDAERTASRPEVPAMLRHRSVLVLACATALVIAAPATAATYRVAGKSVAVDEAAGLSAMRGGLIGDWTTTSFELLRSRRWSAGGGRRPSRAA